MKLHYGVAIIAAINGAICAYQGNLNATGAWILVVWYATVLGGADVSES